MPRRVTRPYELKLRLTSDLEAHVQASAAGRTRTDVVTEALRLHRAVMDVLERRP